MKKLIAWEKWNDPFAHLVEDEDSDDDEPTFERKGHKAVMTQMGIFPVTEYSQPGKTFNFWIGYTNFPITRKVHKLINNMTGVETLDVFTKYRFRIGVGKLFDEASVMRAIDKGLIEHYVEKDKSLEVKDQGVSGLPNIKDLLRDTYGKTA